MDTNSTMTNISAAVEKRPVTPITPTPVPNTHKAPGFWAFVGLIVLFAIPVIGFIANIVFACGANKNQSITNFARAYLVVALVGCILTVALGVAAAVAVTSILTTNVQPFIEQLQNGEIDLGVLLPLVTPFLGDLVEQNMDTLLQSDAAGEYIEEFLADQGVTVDINEFKQQYGDEWETKLNEHLDEKGVDVDLNDIKDKIVDELGNVDISDFGGVDESDVLASLASAA